MINFVAPGLLPENATFRQLFETPITQAQERGATLVQCMLGAARAEYVCVCVTVHLCTYMCDSTYAYTHNLMHPTSHHQPHHHHH